MQKACATKKQDNALDVLRLSFTISHNTNENSIVLSTLRSLCQTILCLKYDFLNTMASSAVVYVNSPTDGALTGHAEVLLRGSATGYGWL